MICARCARAADQRAPRDAHCTDPKCPCGHRVERYRPVTGFDVRPIAKSTCTATLQRVGDINRRCTEQIHPGDYHHDDIWSWHDTDPGATPHTDTTTED